MSMRGAMSDGGRAGYARGMVTQVVAALRTAVVVPVFFSLTLRLAALVTLISLVREDAPVIERIIRVWSRLFLLAAGVRLEIVGRDRVDASGQYVFMANHLSNLDIPVMFLTAPVPIRYLAKKEVYKIPFVATAMRRIGIVRVDRTGGSSIHSEVNAGVAAAKARGHSLIIFPEGTRSPTGDMQEFKKGAFRIAIGHGLPVVPVTIEGTWKVWPPGSKLLFPGRARAVIHELIPTEGTEPSDIDGLRDRVREIIGESYERLRSGT